MDFVSGLIAGFLLFPATFGPIALLLFILAGVVMMGLFDGKLSLLAFFLLLYFVLGGGGVLGASIATAGIFTMLLWLVIAAVFVFDLGRVMHRRSMFTFTLHLIFLATVAMVVFMHHYLLTVWEAFFCTLLVTAVYLVVGGAVALFWKWPKYNREVNESMFAKQASWMRSRIQVAVDYVEPEPVIEPDEEAVSIRRTATRQKKPQSLMYDLTPDQVRVLKSLQGKKEHELGRMKVPDVLLRSWNDYRRMNDIVSPSLSQSKGLFFSWMMGWPGIVAYEALHDIVETLSRILSRVFNWFYQRVGGALRRTQAKLLGDRTDLMELPDEEQTPAE